MNEITQFEDLSNDLFLEIFDYFHALDLFMAFSLLNDRITSILSLTQLHIVISKLHCRYQLESLSSHLFQHAHQVISVSLHDQLYDFSSVISFIFNQHTFENLRTCQFYIIHPSSKFHDVIRKLESFTKLVSFEIIQPSDTCLSDAIKQDLVETILTHKSRALRSVDLIFAYNYPKLVASIVLNSTITSLYMSFRGSIVTCSIYSVLPILRHYRALRVLHIVISNDDKLSTRQTILPTLPATYEYNPPISPSLTTFNLRIRTLCDFHSLNFILHCMPNLRRFIIHIIYLPSFSSLWRDIFDGYKWQQLLTRNTSYLDVFDISLIVNDLNFVLNMSNVVKSFDCFATKYDDWYVAINRSRRSLNNPKQQIILRGYRQSKNTRYYMVSKEWMVLGTLNVCETTVTDNQHYLFYSPINDLHLNIPINMKNFDTLPSGQLFKNIDHLTIELDSSMLTFWENILYLFNIRSHATEIDQKERADKLANLVDLTHITKLEIQPMDDSSQLSFIKEVLLASSRVVQLIIGNALIFSPILYDDLSLTPVFDRLQSLHLLTELINFPLIYALKLVERFPSLIHLEVEIFSIDLCIPLLNILLDGLAKLVHLKIHFYVNMLSGDGTCFIDHVIEIRRQAFPHHIYNRNEVFIKINEQIMDIYLSSCSICANTKYII